MKKILITHFLLLYTLISYSQLNETVFVEKIGKDILIGECNRTGLQLPQIGDWYMQEYNIYQPSERVIKKIKSEFSNDISITVVLATWCHDSKREVPRFYKIIDLAGIDEKYLTVYSTDLKKTVKGVDISNLDIQRVPTFIIYRNGIEIGRIIESPNRSLEKDLLKILRKK